MRYDDFIEQRRDTGVPFLDDPVGTREEEMRFKGEESIIKRVTKYIEEKEEHENGRLHPCQ